MVALSGISSHELAESAGVHSAPATVVGTATATASVPGAIGRRIGEVIPAWRATLRRRDSPGVVIADLDTAKDLHWQDTLNDAGAASLVLTNDDPALALIGYGDLILFEVDGIAAFTMVVRQLDRVEISEGEDAARLTTVTGPSSVAILEEAVVYGVRPLWSWPIEETRHFNWTAFDYYDAWWQQTMVVVSYQDVFNEGYWSTNMGDGGILALPRDFPDYDGSWQWAHGATPRYAEPGTCYFRGVFNVTAEYRRVRIYAMVDNVGQIYFDGQHQGEVEWRGDESSTLQLEIDTSPGLHVVCVEATNSYVEVSAAVRDMNPGGLLMTIYGLDALDHDVDPPLFRSDGFVSWVVLPYPAAAPGMTAGEALVHCFREAQYRGGLVGVTLAFDEHYDSAGRPWPIMADVSTQIGYDLLTFAKELANTYIDFAMAPGSLTFYAWAKDGRGRVTGVNLHGATDPADPNSGNLRQLSYTRVL